MQKVQAGILVGQHLTRAKQQPPVCSGRCVPVPASSPDCFSSHVVLGSTDTRDCVKTEHFSEEERTVWFISALTTVGVSLVSSDFWKQCLSGNFCPVPLGSKFHSLPLAAIILFLLFSTKPASRRDFKLIHTKGRKTDETIGRLPNRSHSSQLNKKVLKKADTSSH